MEGWKYENYEKKEQKWEKFKNWPSFNERLDEVCERYPGLSEKIKLSLETPQLGKYHNEGPQMDSHLKLILKNLEKVTKGIFYKEVSNDLKEVFQSMVSNEERKNDINPDFIDYTFLHDISKPDCLSLKIEGEKKRVEISWEEWKNGADKSSQTYNGKKIETISYFHQSEGSMGQHGNKAASFLRNFGVPDIIIKAIAKHEVAYQFSKINPKVYKKHFIDSGFSLEEQNFILLASYLDSSSSLDQNHKPNLKSFENLVASKRNFELIQSLLKTNDLSERDLAKLMKYQREFHSLEDIETFLKRHN